MKPLLKKLLSAKSNPSWYGGAKCMTCKHSKIAAINGEAGAGTLYGTGTLPHHRGYAAAGAGDTMAFLPFRGIATHSETMANGSWGSLWPSFGGLWTHSQVLSQNDLAQGHSPSSQCRLGLSIRRMRI